MKKLAILSVCLALAGATEVVKADFITGELDLGGFGTFNASPIGSATKLTSAGSPSVEAAFDDLSAVTTASINLPAGGLSLNFGSTVSGLLTFDGFTFDLGSSSTTPAGPYYVNASGYGTLSGNGYSATTFAYSFTATETHASPNAPYSIDIYSLPDGGTTVTLLGGALTVLGLVRRKLVA